MTPPDTETAPSDLAAEVAAHGWYHTIELPGGVTTPGLFDTVSAAPKSLIPASLAGKRCLDVATSNGFWAFEMEKRGAAEVVAIDIPGHADVDWPAFDAMADKVLHEQSTKDSFDVAHRALGSKVEHRFLSAYNVSPEELGTFDFVFVGTVLLHLRDPVKVLTAVHSVTKGELVLNESISLPLTLSHPRTPTARLIGTGGSNWWVPNVAALKRMTEAAGFDVAETTRPFVLHFGEGRPKWGRAATGARVKGLIRNAGRAVAGLPHVGVRAIPRTTVRPG
jgi:tRNA (mo5U34)-methyltransferase